MDPISLQATRRDIVGKKVKNLRRQGLVPANLFGHNVPSIPLQLDAHQMAKALRAAGTHALISLHLDDQPPKTVLVRGFHADPRTGQLLHVDLYQVAMKEKLRAKVPLTFVGDAPAVSRYGGILVRGANEIEIECLPKDLPPAITVDISQLAELDSSIRARDLTPTPGVTIITDSEEMIARVAAPRVEKEEEVAAPEAPPEAKAEKEEEAALPEEASA